jgi:hypothetical protein
MYPRASASGTEEDSDPEACPAAGAANARMMGCGWVPSPGSTVRGTPGVAKVTKLSPTAVNGPIARPARTKLTATV